MGFMPMLKTIWEKDAFAKARGEPTQVFHNIQPNPNNPEIAAIYAEQKKAQAPKAPPKVEPKQEPIKAEPKKIESTPQPVKSKKTRGQTIMDPFATKDVTYRKKLLGD